MIDPDMAIKANELYPGRTFPAGPPKRETGTDGTTMTERPDGTWECSAGCPLVFQRDENQDDVAYHLEWHAEQEKK